MKAVWGTMFELNQREPVMMRDCWERVVARCIWQAAAGKRSEVPQSDGWLVVRRELRAVRLTAFVRADWIFLPVVLVSCVEGEPGALASAAAEIGRRRTMEGKEEIGAARLLVRSS